MIVLKYYIVDDDVNIVKILTNIIEEKNLGEVIGSAEDGIKAINGILITDPDIVLVDLLMPELDGNTLIREVKSIKPKINFIMISQVSDYELVTEAYQSGVEFYIGKPVNIIEVEKVIKKVAEKIGLENMLNNIRNMFEDNFEKKDTVKDKTKEVKYILGILGMLGGRGTSDIIKIYRYLVQTKESYDECNIGEICRQLGDNEKTVKQRIRRSMKNGLTNLAQLGIEDYYSEVFQTYSGVLFDFEDVKAEMDFYRGKRQFGGKVNINKFFEGLALLCEKDDL